MTPAVLSKPAAATLDAVEILVADHDQTRALFSEFDWAEGAKEKGALAARACAALETHMAIEEEIFYPAFQAALAGRETVAEAEAEHSGIKDLVAQLRGLDAGSEDFDARVEAMGELFDRHAGEEEQEMFPAARTSRALDLDALGARMSTRKLELARAPDGAALTRAPHRAERDQLHAP